VKPVIPHRPRTFHIDTITIISRQRKILSPTQAHSCTHTGNSGRTFFARQGVDFGHLACVIKHQNPQLALVDLQQFENVRRIKLDAAGISQIVADFPFLKTADCLKIILSLIVKDFILPAIIIK
jgi:hypothetical protein